MKKKYTQLLFTALLGLFVFNSCSVGNYSKSYRNSATMAPLVRLELSLDDLGYLGEETVSIKYRNYIFFKTIDSINNHPYMRRVENNGYLNGLNDIRLSKKLNMATYKVLEDYPQADYFVISNRTINTQKMFMGKIVKEYATIKAYKFRK